MKANLILVVSLVTALSLMTFGAEAANGTLWVPLDIPVTAEVPVDIPVNIDDINYGIEGMSAFLITISYDILQLQYNSCVLGDVTPGWSKIGRAHV